MNSWRTKELCPVESNESFDTPALPQPQITPLKQRKVGARLGSVPTNRRPSSQPELVGQRYGSVMVISPDVLWLGQRHRRFMHVLCECVDCGYRSVISLSNLKGGRTKGCRSCNQPQQFPKWLYARAQNMKQRCNNPNDRRFKDYGGRGIEFRFDSVTTCALWVRDNLGIPDDPETVELDRIENDGHYEPGNLRWATRRKNMNNTRVSKWGPLMHKFRLEHPEVRYADASLRSFLASGMSFEAIVERWATPSDKPKGKYGTYSTADPEIASLAKDC